MKRLLPLFLILVLLFTGRLSCTDPQVDTVLPTPTETPTQTVEQPKEPTTQPTKQPAEELSEASKAFRELDRSFFLEYVTTDLTTLQQFIKHPEVLDINRDEVKNTLGSFSKEEDAETTAWYREQLDALHAIDRSQLTAREQMAYDVMERDFTETLEMEPYYGCYEPLVEYSGLQTDLPISLWLFDINSKWDAEAYLDLLADVPRFYGELLQYEQYRADMGLFMTETALDAILDNLDDIIEVRDSIFLIHTYNEAVDALSDVTPEEAAALKEKNQSLLTNEFYQAHVDLKAGLEALRPKCRAPLGAAASGNELYKEYFAKQLVITCADNKTPEEIGDLLLGQIRNSLNDYRKAARKLGYDPDLDNLKFSVGDMDESIAYLHETLDPVLPEIPSVNVTYKYVPEELSDILSPAFYLNPSFDDWQNNVIGLNKPEDASNLISTLAHEGYNGHLYQFIYHRSMDDLPWSQQVLERTSYAEAWSQESERLLATYAKGKIDANLLMTDHANDSFFTVTAAYASVLVNYYGYDKSTFQKNMDETFGFTKTFTDWLYDFAVDNPFYYMNYAYSYTRLQDLYNHAQKELGKKFDEKAFFQTYLDCGPATFDLIEARIDAWIAEQK